MTIAQRMEPSEDVLERALAAVGNALGFVYDAQAEAETLVDRLEARLDELELFNQTERPEYERADAAHDAAVALRDALAEVLDTLEGHEEAPPALEGYDWDEVSR